MVDILDKFLESLTLEGKDVVQKYARKIIERANSRVEEVKNKEKNDTINKKSIDIYKSIKELNNKIIKKWSDSLEKYKNQELVLEKLKSKRKELIEMKKIAKLEIESLYSL